VSFFWINRAVIWTMGGELISINFFKNINKVLVLLGKVDRCWF